MARSTFFADVRRAVSWMAPRVEADSPFTDTDYIQKTLRGLDFWLKPEVVEAFNRDDFTELNEGRRKDLIKAVDEFRRAAADVNSGERSLEGRRDVALSSFTQIVQAVQELVRNDWVSASMALLAEAETWAKEQDWPTKRYPRDITEDFIGKYTLDRLVYSAEGSQLALVPVGRFAPGTDGMFDLAVLPAYDSVTVVRKQDKWFIHPLPNKDGREDWSKEAFVSKSLQLARLS